MPQATDSLSAEHELGRRVRVRARELGFDLVGFASAVPPPQADFARYAELVSRGWHGTMAYLAAGLEARRGVDRPEIVPGARTVISVGWSYRRSSTEELADPPLAQWIARYARGRDYHGFLRKRLGALAAYVRTLGPSVRARAFCDTGPILERAWAARAGIGFVGHNCLLIAPGLGSYLLLGEVITTLELPSARPVAADCGNCRACLDACPTAALLAPRTIDPRRCLAYLTIELREPIVPDLREAATGRLFGCDRCQEVCPHNGVDARPSLDPEPSRPLRRWSRLGLRDMVVLDEEGWTATARGTALCRVPAWVMARNALLVAWRLTQEDPIAARAALAAGRSHAHERVRELAAWLTARAG